MKKEVPAMTSDKVLRELRELEREMREFSAEMREWFVEMNAIFDRIDQRIADYEARKRASPLTPPA
jgi:predicted transcriptional regulator